jgi:putative DNA primase/helicase
MIRSPSDAALRYAACWAVFPCIAEGPHRKRPHISGGFHSASRDKAQIREWWSRWPLALVGCPMGLTTGAVVLDVDVSEKVNGYDTLEELGVVPLPDTPIVHTPRGGVHYYFDPCGRRIDSSAGKIGKGLDVRGEGGYVCLPSPGSGYTWDPHKNFKTTPLTPAPEWLMPSEPRLSPWPIRHPSRPCELSPYAADAINSAVRNIYNAGPGHQYTTLNRECFGIGGLVGGGHAPEAVAIAALLHAAHAMPSYDARRPWRRAEVERKVRASFGDGLRSPR